MKEKKKIKRQQFLLVISLILLFMGFMSLIIGIRALTRDNLNQTMYNDIKLQSAQLVEQQRKIVELNDLKYENEMIIITLNNQVSTLENDNTTLLSNLDTANAELTTLREQGVSDQERISELETLVSDYETQITNNQQTITQHENTILSLENQIEILEFRIVELENLISVYEQNLFALIIEKKITHVTAGDLQGVTTIGNYAFYGCESLVFIELPNTITSIGMSAFQNCKALASISIPESVTEIKQNAFSGCSSLKTIELSNSVTKIEQGCFQSCDWDSLYYNGTIEDWCNIEFQNANANPLTMCNSKVRKFYIKNGTGEYIECPKILSLDIESVNKYSLVGYVESVTFSNNLLSLGEGVFSGNKSLVYVDVGNSITEISRNLFNSCDNLVYLTIPSSVTSIGYYSLDCKGLRELTVLAEVPPTCSANSVLSQCLSLETIYILNETLEAYQNAYGWSLRANKLVELPVENVA